MNEPKNKKFNRSYIYENWEMKGDESTAHYKIKRKNRKAHLLTSSRINRIKKSGKQFRGNHIIILYNPKQHKPHQDISQDP